MQFVFLFLGKMSPMFPLGILKNTSPKPTSFPGPPLTRVHTPNSIQPMPSDPLPLPCIHCTRHSSHFLPHESPCTPPIKAPSLPQSIHILYILKTPPSVPQAPPSISTHPHPLNTHPQHTLSSWEGLSISKLLQGSGRPPAEFGVAWSGLALFLQGLPLIPGALASPQFGPEGSKSLYC